MRSIWSDFTKLSDVVSRDGVSFAFLEFGIELFVPTTNQKDPGSPLRPKLSSNVPLRSETEGKATRILGQNSAFPEGPVIQFIANLQSPRNSSGPTDVVVLPLERSST
ncbi:hypothetical protein ACOME3_009309 [Neoechinorhynchus agilis]